MVERTICASPNLAAQDVELADAYKAASRVVPSADLAAFRYGQRAWLSARGTTCANEDDRFFAGCLGVDYDDRISRLRSVSATPREALANILWTTGWCATGTGR